MSKPSGKPLCCICCGSCSLLLAVLLLAAGAGITSLFSWQFKEQLKVLMPLANGSMSYQGWERVPTDLLFEIWLWNVTNPIAVTKNGARPKLQQVGPFAFKEKRYKTDILFYDNDTVAFREYQQFYFDVSKSIGPMENFTITSVNMPYAVTEFRMRPVKVSGRRFVARMFERKSGGLFITRPANEILLGYEDSLLKLISPLIKRFMPNQPMKTRSGLFIGQNNTHKGLFLVHTGKGDLLQFNQIQRWNGKSEIDIWPQDWANQIDGTDGSMFSPMVSPKQKLKIFTTDICRSLEMEYQGNSEVLGIPSLKFGPVPDLMLNATLKPKNSAFCTPHCLDSGVQDITKCKDNVPLAISAPHFTDAETYAAAIDGLNPGGQYRTVIEVEPNTGFVINAGRKMQMNLILKQNQEFADMKKLPELMLLPLMWLNESGGIEPEAARQFKQHLLAPIQIVAMMQWLLLACGAAVAFVTIGMLCYTICWRIRRRRRRRSSNRRKGGDFGIREEDEVQLKHEMSMGESKNGQQNRASILVDDDFIMRLQDKSLRESHIL